VPTVIALDKDIAIKWSLIFLIIKISH
jgi:hypothetical protein